MKIAIIGNSHAAAVQRALTDGTYRHHATFDFLVKAGGGAPVLGLKDGYLNARGGPGREGTYTSGLVDRLDPASYDAILFIAAGMPAATRKNTGHLLNALLHASFAARPHDHLQSVSDSVMTLALERALLAMPNMPGLDLIRTVFAGPLVIVTCPIPGADLKGSPIQTDLPDQYAHNLPAFMSWYYAVQNRVISARAQRLGAYLLTPPAEFLEAGIAPVEFCAPDQWHMNAAYGHLTLERALRLIGGSPAV